MSEVVRPTVPDPARARAKEEEPEPGEDWEGEERPEEYAGLFDDP